MRQNQGMYSGALTRHRQQQQQLQQPDQSQPFSQNYDYMVDGANAFLMHMSNQLVII